MDLNKVMIVGTSTGATELKKITSNNSSVVNFTIASNRRYKNNEGENQEESEYHRCVAYGNSAEILANYLEKSKRIFIQGRLRTRKWLDENDVTKYITEIIVDEFIFLDRRNKE